MHKLTSFAQAPRALWSAFTLIAVLSVTSHVSAQGAQTGAAPKAQGTTTPPAQAQTTAVPTDKTAPKTTSESAETSTEEATPAGPTPEEQKAAMTAFEAGKTAFEAGTFEEAAAHFRTAYAAIPSPHAEYWIAVSLDKADPEGTNPEQVAAAYQTLLNNPGAAHIGTDKVEEAKARFLELRKFLPAKITILSTPAGATVKVDGAVQPGVTPIDLEVKEGTHVIELSLDGFQNAIVDAQVSGGVHLEQQVQLTELPPPPPPPSPVTQPEPVEEKKRSIVPAAVTLGLGGAGLIAGTVFGIMALNAKGKFKDDPTTENADAAERNALIADMSFGVALTLGITGIVLLTSKEPATQTAKRKQKNDFLIAPYASPRGAGAAARMTF